MKIIKKTVYQLPNASQTNFVKQAEWSDEYGLIILKGRKPELFVNDNPIPIKMNLIHPEIRWVNQKTIAIVDKGCKDGSDNAFLINIEGDILHSFHCGMSIGAVEVSEKGIWVGYVNANKGGEDLSQEGIVFFNFKGKVLYRYHRNLLNEQNFIEDCSSLCKGESNTLWIYYYKPFRLNHWDPNKLNIVRTYTPPEILHGATELCVRDGYAYFGDTYDSLNLYAWKLGSSEEVISLGEPGGYLRGLGPNEEHHFIGISLGEVSLYRIKH